MLDYDSPGCHGWCPFPLRPMIAILFLSVVFCQALTGCGKAPPPAEESAGEKEAAGPRKTGKSKEKELAQSDKPGANDADADESPRPSKRKAKEIGGIPLDVWFDDPLAVARNNAPIGGGMGAAPSAVAPPVATESPARTTAPPASPEASPGGGGDDGWKALLSSDDITDETKQARLRLTEALSTVGKYNGKYKDLQVDAAVLAVVGNIVGQHPEPGVSWKGNAKYVRDLSADVAKKRGLGQKDYEATKTSFDKLADLLGGNKPGGLEESAATVPFSEIAGRGPLMLRMERAFTYLKANIKDEASFKKDAVQAAHEAAILAALSKVVGTDGYASSDEDEYKNFVKEMVKAGLDMSTAAKNDNYKDFSDGLNRAQKLCTECHTTYKT